MCFMKKRTKNQVEKELHMLWNLIVLLVGKLNSINFLLVGNRKNLSISFASGAYVFIMIISCNVAESFYIIYRYKYHSFSFLYIFYFIF